MTFERIATGLTGTETVTDKILKREPQREDKDGNIIKGDYPNEYFTLTPGLFSKDATLGNKNANDLLYDYRHIQIINRVIRESIPPEQYTMLDLIRELDREYAAVNLDTMNKEGTNNNRRLLNTNITESTTKSIGATEEKKKGLLGMFSRR